MLFSFRYFEGRLSLKAFNCIFREEDYRIFFLNIFFLNIFPLKIHLCIIVATL
ncbi:hypothetical protein HMPREF6123_2119 [Oribacterium sinus F0268]|uniref:Uncharacterized protein n=1 Tax=Oribacterium sinus F0268 TaxID=585501 RepID=C2L050_9FIRM|nr:hypothetical protein HMPREF6123_2119 [Oribacterium sinus F0268]